MAYLELICPLKMVIFHSYVSLPEGKSYENDVNMMWKLYESDMKTP